MTTPSFSVPHNAMVATAEEGKVMGVIGFNAGLWIGVIGERFGDTFFVHDTFGYPTEAETEAEMETMMAERAWEVSN